MMKKILVLCLGIAMGGSALAQGQTVELNLEQALAIALDQNTTIKIADMEIQKQSYVKRETKGNLLPTVGATGGYTRNIMSQTLGGSIKIQGDNNLSAAANLSLPLFAPGIWNLLRLNDQQMMAAIEASRGSKITLVGGVKKGFYNILLAQQSLEVLKASEKTIGETVDNTRTMYKNGLVAEYDLLTAEVQLSNLKPTILQTELALSVGKTMFKMLLGLGEDIDLQVKGNLGDFREAIASSETKFSVDISENNDLKTLEIQQNILAQQLKVQRTNRMPTMGAVANISFAGTDMPPLSFAGMAATTSNYKYNWQHPFYVGAQLSIPIFAGNSRVNKERQIKTTINQMDYQRSYAEEGVKVQINTSINNILTARESMTANEKTVATAKKAYDIAKTRYAAGAGTMLELNSAELNMTQAQLNYAQTICNYMIAQADYEQIIGVEK